MAYSDVILTEPGLVSYWRLDEASGSVLDSKDANTGTVNGSGITRAVPGLISDVDTALSSNGTTGTYIRIPHNANLDGGSQITIEAWVKPAGIPASTSPWLITRDSVNKCWQIRHYQSGDARWEFNVYDSAGTRIVTTVTSPTAAVGTRQHLVMTFDATAGLKAYINGVQVGTASGTGLSVGSDSSDTLLLAHSSTDTVGFNGTLDEVAFYNTALTLTQIQTHYNTGTGPWSASPPAAKGVATAWPLSGPPAPLNLFPPAAGATARSLRPDIRDFHFGPVRVVREVPPTRLHVAITTPDGHRYRWGRDARNGENVPDGLRFSSTAPGGYESLDVTLARNPRLDYNDLEELSDLRVLGPGGELAGEYRLEGRPITSGDQMAVSPSAVGWQNHLNDRESESCLFIDRDLSHWTGASNLRNEALQNAGYAPNGASVDPGIPARLTLEVQQPNQAASPSLTQPWTVTEGYYNPGSGIQIGKVRATTRNFPTTGLGAGWVFRLFLCDREGYTTDGSGKRTLVAAGQPPPAGSGGGLLVTSNLSTAGNSTVEAIAVAGDIRAVAQLYYNGALVNQATYDGYLENLRVIGNHGLTIYPVDGSRPDVEGVLASDVVQYIITHFAPLINVNPQNVQTSTFIIPDLMFTSTTPGDMINQTLRFGIPPPDWFVWGGRQFYLHDQGINNRHWRARIGPSKMSETGPQIDKLFNQIVVEYSDVDGSTYTVGPTGSGADTIDDTLVDPDPMNPLNQYRAPNGSPLIKRHYLTMGTSAPDIASVVGRNFLQSAKLVTHAGQASLVGYVEDADTGILAPYWAVKAGDTLAFTDAADTSPRRITRADHDDGSKTCTVSLDAPPDTMSGMLERLGAEITSIGLG